MIDKKDISIVIQGPLDDRTYEAIDCYKDFGEVIVANWNNESLQVLEPCSGAYRMASSSYGQFDPNNGFMFGMYQAITTLAGSRQANLEYVLKTRSDELYPNLDAMIDNLNKYPDRSHTTDNGFWKYFPFCYSNHIFIDKKENIVRGLEKGLNTKYNFATDEQFFGYYLMAGRGLEITNSNWKQIFRENVFITRCVELPNHLHSGQSGAGRYFKRSSDPYPNGRLECDSKKHNKQELYQSIEEIIL